MLSLTSPVGPDGRNRFELSADGGPTMETRSDLIADNAEAMRRALRNAHWTLPYGLFEAGAHLNARPGQEPALSIPLPDDHSILWRQVHGVTRFDLECVVECLAVPQRLDGSNDRGRMGVGGKLRRQCFIPDG